MYGKRVDSRQLRRSLSGRCVCGLASGGGEAAPPVGFIEPQLRRRPSRYLIASPLHVASPPAVKDGEAVRVVLLPHGELGARAELSPQLAAAEMPPMAFAFGAHAAPGLYWYRAPDRSASTAVSAVAETFPMALIEAAAQGWGEPNPGRRCVRRRAPPASNRALVDTPRRAHA